MTQRDLRERAAQEIERRGWAQGNYAFRDGRVCMRGAVRIAAGQSFDDLMAGHGPGDRVVVAEERIARQCGFSGPCPAAKMSAWNDAPSRTQADVLARLRGQ